MNKILIIDPGKGWGHFVSKMYCYQKLANHLNVKIITGEKGDTIKCWEDEFRLQKNVDTGLGVIFNEGIRLGIVGITGNLTYTVNNGKVTITILTFGPF